MSLKEKIKEDLRVALKNKLSLKTDVLRFLLAQIHNREIEKRDSAPESRDDLSDEEVVDVLRKEAKKRKESIELFQKGGRPDLAQKEDKELSLINEYLPSLLDRQQIEATVKKIQLGGFGDFNSLMKETMNRLKGQAEGKIVSEVVRKVLERKDR